MKIHRATIGFSIAIAVLALAVRAFFAPLWPNIVADGLTLVAVVVMVWVDEHI